MLGRLCCATSSFQPPALSLTHASHPLCVAEPASTPANIASVSVPAGEAYDKVARMLGLDLRPNGGAALEAIARQGDPQVRHLLTHGTCCLWVCAAIGICYTVHVHVVWQYACHTC